MLDPGPVDWGRVREAGHAALAAPTDIDPVPAAIGVLIARLPEHRHMRILRRSDWAAPVTLPACADQGGGRRMLSLPSTPQDADARERYLATAHPCLADRQARHWIVDLTGAVRPQRA